MIQQSAACVGLQLQQLQQLQRFEVFITQGDDAHQATRGVRPRARISSQ
jgi:hypothetical protein